MIRLTLSIAFLLFVSTVSAQLPAEGYNSNPGADLTIYLDFNGHITRNTYWNEDNDIGSPEEIVTPKFTRDDLIRDIWARVAEDYAPFNVNVTTYLPGEKADGFEDLLTRSTSGDHQYGVRAAIGGNSDWTGLVIGGRAYINTFGDPKNGPAMVFSDNLKDGRDPKTIAECITHEVGHNLGLYHDGQLLVGEAEDGSDRVISYYEGTDDWAPIMGSSYDSKVTQWSKGEYPSANELQDDLAEINEWLDYRDDAHGYVDADGHIVDEEGLVITTHESLNDIAKVNTNTGLKEFSLEGFIEQNTDIDSFEFSLGEGGNFSFNVVSGIWSPEGTNLDVLAILSYLDPLEGLKNLLTWNPTNMMGIEDVSNLAAYTLQAGTYFLSLDGTGRETGVEGIYSDYGSIGTYRLSGWIQEGEFAPAPDGTAPEPATLVIISLGFVGLGIVVQQGRK